MKNLKYILDSHDIFLVDVYGILRDENKEIPGVNKTMEYLVNQSKKVIILSNATGRSSDLSEMLNKLGYHKDIHFNEVVSSGEVLHETIKNGRLEFNENKNPKKFYCFGTLKQGIFDNNFYTETKNLSEADFCFFSTPHLSENDIKNCPKGSYSKSIVFEGKYNSLIVDNFLNEITNIKKYNIPALSANLDTVSLEEGHYIIAQGSIVREYRKLGGEVLEFGKPDTKVYKYLFEKFLSESELSKSEKILMIGDTISTDILGTINTNKDLNLNMHSILIETGKTKRSANNARMKTNEFCKEKGIIPTYIEENLIL